MHIQTTARHFKASQSLQEFVEEGVRGLTQIYDGIISAEVVLEDNHQAGGNRMAEVTLSVAGERLFAKETTDDMIKSVQACVDKLERQLTRYKEKLHEGSRPHERPEMNPPLG